MELLTPVRRGRLAGPGDWRAQYRALHMTPQEALTWIRDGDVLLTTGASVPLSRRRGQEIKQQYLDALHREGTLLL